jgi:hypothetical protein
MVGYQAEAMDAVSEAFNSFLEEEIKEGAILVIEENRLAIIATEDNVIQCSGVGSSWFSSHEIKLRDNPQYCKPDRIFFNSCLQQFLSGYCLRGAKPSFLPPREALQALVPGNNNKVFSISSAVTFCTKFSKEN